MGPTATPLEGLVRARIAEHGPMSFADFMEAALYHPEHGYYSRLRGFGPDGDFITSPEVHPAFGALLARQAVDVWEALGKPEPFRVLEVGGGSGALAHWLIRALQHEAPALAEALSYTIDERSAALRQAQQEVLSDFGVQWGRPPSPHLVLANEVLDALPVHRVVVRGVALRELRVGVDADGRLAWVEVDDVPAAVSAYFDDLELLPPEGAIAEVNLNLGPWARQLAQTLERGLAIVLDYGYLAAELFARPQGTLLTYYRHTLGSDPLVRVGEQDISAHVDFTTLATSAHRAGLRVLGMVSQAALLRNLGLDQLAAAQLDPANRSALAALVDPAGLGRVNALFLARGMGDYLPSGLSGARTWPAPTWFQPTEPAPPPADFLRLWREAFGPPGA